MHRHKLWFQLKHLSYLFGLLIASIFVTGCDRLPIGHHEESLVSQLESGEYGAEHDGEHHTKENIYSETNEPTLNLEHLLTMETIIVSLGNHSDDSTFEPFRTVARKNYIIHYPCSRCHTQRLTLTETTDHSKEVWNLEHSTDQVLACTVCHQEEDMDQLQTIRGISVDFDHSYQICAQCHVTQLKEWQGGAHGKRLNGWAPPRVVQTCVGCHSPHQPAFKQRPPTTFGD